MTVLFDTASLPPRERPEPWMDAHERIFVPTRVRLARPDPCAGRITAHRVGSLGVYRVTSDASIVRRGAIDADHLVVATPLRGTSRIEQDARATVVAPGELTSWDSSRPFEVKHLDAFDLLLIVVPRALLGPRRDALCARTAGRLDGALAGPFLRGVWRSLEAGASPGEDIADALVALVRALHAGDAPRVPGLLGQIKAFIDEHLGDPALGPATIAAAHFISTRYVHKLFAVEDGTVSSWIRARRLDACRRDLLDPALAGEAVSAIAWRWGFANPAHFSRAFRAAYGCSPSELRALAGNASARSG